MTWSFSAPQPHLHQPQLQPPGPPQAQGPVLLFFRVAMDAYDCHAALVEYVELLTRELQADDTGLWMSGIKQLILTL
ncbi:hypothetical protein CVT26_011410 [Gymnopilus dilepis]|uniref:Uncharacterized protein n=1 Tax=Gymnopilus dilepis TaxID=231916 RepID=A0A409X4G3_9AGAR|nr:hypothetical protein CVT26_011410 [Gymnopilus dilepis]